MIQECRTCKCPILTESDAYVVMPRPSGVEISCVLCVAGKEIEALRLELAKAVPWVEWYEDGICDFIGDEKAEAHSRSVHNWIERNRRDGK